MHPTLPGRISVGNKISLVRILLAFLIATIFDIADYFGAFVPYLGEAADVIPALANAILLGNPLPLLGFLELASAFPPLLFADFIPFHIIMFLLAVRKLHLDGKL